MTVKWTLPAPRELDWPMRSVEGCVTGNETLADGRVELTIGHAPLVGVSVEMLEWWFQNFDRPCRYRGVRYEQAYLLWHPIDHHSVVFGRDSSGRMAPGSTIHIREAFGADLAFAVDQVVTVHRWDRGGIGFHLERLGQRVFSLDHTFSAIEGGTRYDSRMLIGLEGGHLSRLANRLIVPRAFGADKARAWLRHNIEEVGCFEHFLPELYEARESHGS